MNYKNPRWPADKILIADDDLYSLILLEKIVRKVCNEVVIAHDGEEALQKLIDDQQIKIAILDILMPKLDGYEVVRKARFICPNVIFIAYTADTARFDKAKFDNSGFYAYLTKPAFPIKILNTINEALLFRPTN